MNNKEHEKKKQHTQKYPTGDTIFSTVGRNLKRKKKYRISVYCSRLYYLYVNGI